MAGYIKAAVRVRPFLRRELQNNGLCVMSVDGSNITLTNDNSDCAQSFTYDAVYWLDYPSQERIMHDIGDAILEDALSGFNSCLFAYGQTGSGKTHTIFGRADEPGIVPWMVIRLFKEKQKLIDQEVELLVWCSCLQIFGDRINDLLQLKDDSLPVRDQPILGVHVPGAVEVPCERDVDVHRLMAFSAKRRAIAATRMNEQSSRSHVMVVIKVRRTETPKNRAGETEARSELHSRLSFFDLAGSERQTKAPPGGNIFLERCALNKGLNALNLLIRELVLSQSKGQQGNVDWRDAGIPYRASNLTFLMKDALAGNCKTRMVANISPCSDSYEDTICTLRFARSVQTLKTIPRANTETRSEVLGILQSELPTLRAQLQQNSAGLSGEKLHLQVEEQERLITEMKEEFSAQIQRHREMDEARDSFLRNMGIQANHCSETAVAVDGVTPCLINMADDPALAGILLFYLPVGQQVSIGSARDNSMRIAGLGISEHMCIIDNRDNHNLTIRKCSEDVRAFIDGQPLQAGISQALQHGQRIRLGRKMLLRLSVPIWLSAGAAKFSEEELELQPQDLLDDRSVHYSPMWLRVKEALDQAAAQMTPEQGEQLYIEAAQAVQMAEEAAEITTLCRPHDGITFEVRVVSGPPFSVAIGILKGSEQIYLWNSRRMAERLDAMRECCQLRMASRKGQIDALDDPWHELHPAAALEKISLLEARLENAQTRQDRQSQSKAGAQLQGSGVGPDMMLLIFISWHRAALGRRRPMKKEAARPPEEPTRHEEAAKRPPFGTDKRAAEPKGASTPRGPISPRSKGEARKGSPNARQSPTRSSSVTRPNSIRNNKTSPRSNAAPEPGNSKRSVVTQAATRKKSLEVKSGRDPSPPRPTVSDRRTNGKSADKTSEASASSAPQADRGSGRGIRRVEPPEKEVTVPAANAGLNNESRPTSEEVKDTVKDTATASEVLPQPSLSSATSAELPADSTLIEGLKSLTDIANPSDNKGKLDSRRSSKESSDLLGSSLGDTFRTQSVSGRNTPSKTASLLDTMRTHSVASGRNTPTKTVSPAPRPRQITAEEVSLGWSPVPQPRAVVPEWSPSSYYRVLVPEETVPARIIASERSPLLHARMIYPVEGSSVTASPAPQARGIRVPDSSPPRQYRVMAAAAETVSVDWSPAPQSRVLAADEVKTRSQAPGQGPEIVDLGMQSPPVLQRQHAVIANTVAQQDPLGSPESKHRTVVRLRATTPPGGGKGASLSRTPRRSLQATGPTFIASIPKSPPTQPRTTATSSPVRTGPYITVPPPLQRPAPALGPPGGAATMPAVTPAGTPPAPLWYAQLGATRVTTTSAAGQWRASPGKPESQPAVLDERRPIASNAA